MNVPRDRVGRKVAVQRARDDDRQFRHELEFTFGQERIALSPTQAIPGVHQVLRRHDPKLATAVVATDRQLQPKRQAKIGGRRERLRDGADLAPRRDTDPGGLDEPSLGESVLGQHERSVSGSDRQTSLERLDDRRGDMFQLIGHDIAGIGKAKRGSHVVIRTDHDDVGEGRGRAIGIRVEDRDPVADGAGSDREHPAELTAAKDADDGGRRESRAGRG